MCPSCPGAPALYQICLLVLNVEDIVEGSASLRGGREWELTDQRASALCVLELLLGLREEPHRQQSTSGRGALRILSFPELEELRSTP